MHSPFRSAGEREADRAEKREAVLLAAVRLFNERGFHVTSLDDVAASLGVTRPVVYHYLGNKDQVLFECVSRGMSLLRQAVDAAAAQPGRGVDRLRAFLVCYAETIMDDFGRCVIRTGDESLSPPSAAEFRRRKAEIDQAMRRLIEEAVADGSIEVGDVRLTAFAFAGALNWPARWHRPDGSLSANEIAHRLVDVLLSGVLPRPRH
jgi:AcrR family transcriptional regulator